MKQYQDLMEELLTAPFKGDRTGTGTYSKFGHSMRFNLQDGFPLVTTKKVPFHLIVKELLWFLEGNTNANDLAEQGCNIWNEWADEEGELGKIYGKQWRSWQCPPNVERMMMEIDILKSGVIEGRYDRQDILNTLDIIQSVCEERSTIDQIREVIQMIKTKPNSRRLIVTAWNPADLPDESISPQENVAHGNMALAACHTMFQFYVSDGKLSCQLMQRSADCFLGVPFNIASYALLTHMIAQVCNLDVGDFIWTGGDTHIYSNHVEQTKELVSREPLPLPTLKLNTDIRDIDAFTLDDIELIGYESHSAIKGKVSV